MRSQHDGARRTRAQLCDTCAKFTHTCHGCVLACTHADACVALPKASTEIRLLARTSSPDFDGCVLLCLVFCSCVFPCDVMVFDSQVLHCAEKMDDELKGRFLISCYLNKYTLQHLNAYIPRF